MSFKVAEVHLEVLCAFMENHRDFAVGRLNAPCARESHKKLWATLANSLNAEGLGNRSVEKWQKTWTDFKYNLKRKASMMKKEITETGGGPTRSISMSRFEKRILAIMGPSFYEGIGQPESGVGFMIGSPTTPTSSNPTISHTAFTDTASTLTTAHSPKAIVSTPVRAKTPAVFSVNEDHSYIVQPNVKKRKRSVEELSVETVEVLNSLNSSIMMLNNRVIPQLTKAINRLADVKSGEIKIE